MPGTDWHVGVLVAPVLFLSWVWPGTAVAWRRSPPCVCLGRSTGLSASLPWPERGGALIPSSHGNQSGELVTSGPELRDLQTKGLYTGRSQEGHPQCPGLAMRGQRPRRTPGPLALTIKLGRLPVALLFLLSEQFKANTGARQEQPETLAQREGGGLRAQAPPRCRRPQTQEGPEPRGQDTATHRTVLSTSVSATGHKELSTSPPSCFTPPDLCP